MEPVNVNFEELKGMKSRLQLNKKEPLYLHPIENIYKSFIMQSTVFLLRSIWNFYHKHEFYLEISMWKNSSVLYFKVIGREIYRPDVFENKFPKKQANSLESAGKVILFLSETHCNRHHQCLCTNYHIR